MIRAFSSLLLAAVIALPAIAGADESAPALLASGRVDEAINALHGQISASPNDAMAHNLLCRAYFSLGDWDRGVSDCEKAVTLAPDNSQFHLWLGRIYGEKADKASFLTAAGLARRVAREFEAAVHLNPRSIDARTDALVDAAEILLHTQHNVPEAVQLLRAYLNSKSQVEQAPAFKVHFLLGSAAEKLGDKKNAESEYRSALELAREFQPAQQALA